MHKNDLNLSRLENILMNSKQIKIAQTDAQTNIADSLIESLLGQKSPATQTPTNKLEPHINETYQLPVQVGQSGESLSSGDKPWMVGSFSPGIATDKNHPKGHNGVDLKAAKGTPVYPIASGIVKDTGVGNISGNFVTILHEEGHVQSFYGHLDSIRTTKGQTVNKSTIIGTVGDTGNAKGRGAHLHYEVKVNGSLINPFSIAGKQVGSLAKKALLYFNIQKLADKFEIFCMLK